MIIEYCHGCMDYSLTIDGHNAYGLIATDTNYITAYQRAKDIIDKSLRNAPNNMKKNN